MICWSLHLFVLTEGTFFSSLLSLLSSFLGSHILTVRETNIFGLPSGSEGKEHACNVGNLYLISGSGRSTGEGNGYPLHILIVHESYIFTQFERVIVMTKCQLKEKLSLLSVYLQTTIHSLNDIALLEMRTKCFYWIYVKYVKINMLKLKSFSLLCTSMDAEYKQLYLHAEMGWILREKHVETIWTADKLSFSVKSGSFVPNSWIGQWSAQFICQKSSEKNFVIIVTPLYIFHSNGYK